MNSVGSIVKLVIGFSLFVLCTPFALVCAGEYTQAKDMIETLSIQQEEPIEEEFNFIAGRSQIDNPTEFNNMCTTGRYNYNTDLVTGAMSFYKDTGIQLYFLSFDFGKEKFETEELLRFQIKNELSSIDNLPYSIVLYDYSTDYDYDEEYYYASSDNLYFGNAVSKYLSTEDIQMINYYIDNAYDLWDYQNRDSELWITVGKNIANGYDIGKITGEQEYTTIDDQIDYYKDELYVSAGIGLTAGVASVVGLILMVLGVVSIIKNKKDEAERRKAEIEYINARATKDILEADMEYMDDLVDKYIEEE